MSPFWEEWRAKSQFAYSLEVSVERLHAGITQDLSGIHHHGQAIISSGSRRLELDAITSEKVGAQQIIEKLDTAYSGARCLQSLGMAAHPKVSQFVNHQGVVDPKYPEGLAQQIIYRADCQSQFARLSNPDIPGADDAPEHNCEADEEGCEQEGQGDEQMEDSASTSASCSDPDDDEGGALGKVQAFIRQHT